jgi:O-antigen/teichoic acid export membrane protein
MSTTLRATAISGLRWTLLNTVGERLLSFGTTMALARLLDPEHFGLYALAFVAIDTFQVFKNLGLDAALIQRTSRVEEAADTAFLVLPVIGLSLFGLLFVLAPRLAAWLGNPEVAAPMQALGAVLVFMSIGNVPAALVQKAMRFDIRTTANLSGMAVYAVLAVVLARLGWGVWSLVAAYLSRWAVTMPIQWIRSGWRPRWRFNAGLLREMLHFSKYVVGAWLVGLLMLNVDRIAIGRWLGATQLGYYTLCLGLANIVMSQLSVQVYQVAFPAFARARQAPELLRRGVLKLLKYLLLLALPVAALLVAAPRELLRVAYGPRWETAAPLLQVLAVGGLLQAVRAGLEPVLLGCGRSSAVFRLNLLQLLLLTGGVVAMAMAGRPVGVAWAVVVAAAVPLAINLALVLREVGLRSAQLLDHLRPVAFSGLAMAAVLAAATGARGELGAWASVPWLWLAGLAAASGLVYGVGVVRWDPPVARELVQLVRPAPANAVPGA